MEKEMKEKLEECERCTYSQIHHATCGPSSYDSNWAFMGCYHKPFKGRMCGEVQRADECPLRK